MLDLWFGTGGVLKVQKTNRKIFVLLIMNSVRLTCKEFIRIGSGLRISDLQKRKDVLYNVDGVHKI